MSHGFHGQDREAAAVSERSPVLWWATARLGLLALLCLAPRLVADDAAPARRVALLVGVNQYLKPGFRDLQFAEADVLAVGAELRKLGFEVTTLLGSETGERQATKANIEAAARRIVAPLGKDDVALVMLSGHGQQLHPDPNSDPNTIDFDKTQSYYCPVDALVNRAETQVSLGFLLDEILAPNVGRKILLVDACRDIPEDRTRGGRNTKGIEGRVVALPEDTAVFFSCRAGQMSFERHELGHGLFTFCVLEGLRREAASAGGEITWARLVAHVNERMVSEELTKLMPPRLRQVPIPAGALPHTVLGKLSSLSPAGLPSSPAGLPAVPTPTPALADSDPFAGKQAGDEWDGNGLKMKFCWCPPGTFLMGSPADEPGRGKDEDQVQVTLTRGFWIGRYEVTQGEFQRIMGFNPSFFQADHIRQSYTVSKLPDLSRFPVEQVKWSDAQQFCERLTRLERMVNRIPSGWEYRLPTEAEWEYACRAGATSPYATGQDLSFEDARFGWFWYKRANADPRYPLDTTDSLPWTVGSYRPNRWGLFDMHGNVAEWCADLYQPKLPGGVDPVVDSGAGTKRVLRGGDWNAYREFCRSAQRSQCEPDQVGQLLGQSVGLRVVLARVPPVAAGLPSSPAGLPAVPTPAPDNSPPTVTVTFPRLSDELQIQVLSSTEVGAVAFPAASGVESIPGAELQGEYQNAESGLQVAALGDGRFAIAVYSQGLPGSGGESNPVETGELSAQDLKLLVKARGFARVQRQSPTLGMPPPEGAIPLFDGTAASLKQRWKAGAQMTDSGELQPGATSVDLFQDFRLHAEFRVPLMPSHRGQARGNSGVYCQGRYQIQILDSFALGGIGNNACGAIYGVQAPSMNVSLPPLVWQTLDVAFTAARWSDARNKLSNARMSVWWNGVLVHREISLPAQTVGSFLQESSEPGPITLENHGCEVLFRNIWVQPLHKSDEAAVTPPAPPPAAIPAPSVAPAPTPGTSSQLDGELPGTRAGEVREFTSLRIKMCWCPPGSFTMGSPKTESGRGPNEDQAPVTLSRGFWLGRTEVTREEWYRVMGTTPGTLRVGESGFNTEGIPVSEVSWEDAAAFCRRLTERERNAGRLPSGWSYQLPTEAQWEYACRAGTTTPYNGDGTGRLSDYCWYDRNTWRHTLVPGRIPEPSEGGLYSPVANRKPNRWGLHDMHGNLWEWCQDWYRDKLPGGTDPLVSTGEGYRVNRGGSWLNSAESCRSATRMGTLPSKRSYTQGFRLALSAAEE